MSLASSVMCLHYESILEFYEGCPVCDSSQTRKTQACKAALVLVGTQDKCSYNKWFVNRCSLSSMPFGIDDPRDLIDKKGSATVSAELLDLCNNIYDGGIVANFTHGADLAKKYLHHYSNRFASQVIAALVMQVTEFEKNSISFIYIIMAMGVFNACVMKIDIHE